MADSFALTLIKAGELGRKESVGRHQKQCLTYQAAQLNCAQMKADINALGAMLRDARNALGLSLRDVEPKADISNAYLSQLEGGKIKQPSPAILHKLCELYGTSYSAALEFAGYPVPSQSQSSAKQRFASRLGRTTPQEEEALVEYLQFLRTRRRRGET